MSEVQSAGSQRPVEPPTGESGPRMTGAQGRIESHPVWLDREEYPFPRRIMNLGSHAVHFINEGTGPTLLIVHAGPGWSLMYRDVILELRQTFRCVLPDFPGTGLSPSAPEYPHTLESGTELLEEFVEALGLHDAVMWVHGLGGPVGLALAADRPAWFAGLVISDTFAFPLDQYFLGRNMMRMVGSGGFSRINRATNLMAHAISSPFGAGRCLSPKGRAAFRAAYAPGEARRYGSLLMRSCVQSGETLRRTEEGLRHRAPHTPALILFGEKDNAIRLGFEARFRAIFPKAGHARVKDAHHFPMGDDPAAVADFITVWWRSQDGSSEI